MLMGNRNWRNGGTRGLVGANPLNQSTLRTVGGGGFAGGTVGREYCLITRGYFSWNSLGRY